MKTLALLMSTVLAATAFADARPLAVGAPDGSGSVTITIGGPGTQNQTLIAAWAARDMGDDPLAWTEYADAGTVAPADTSKTFQIPAAWLAKSGAVRFFLMSGEKPYLTRYDYVTRPPVPTNNGDTWLKTTIYPDSTLDISVKFRSDYTSSQNMCPFGIGGIVHIFPNSETEYYYDFFGAKGTTHNGILNTTHTNEFGTPPPHDAQPHTFRINREGLFIDGYRHLAFDQTLIKATQALADPQGPVGGRQIGLFDRNNGFKSQGTSVSIYSALIITNNVLARDYVPCAKTDGTVTMYDRVSGTFSEVGKHTSSSYENPHLEAGNDIGPYPTDCGTVESRSATVNLPMAVGALDGEGNVTVTFGGTGTQNQTLIAAWANGDKGSDPLDWTEYADAGTVVPGETSKTFQIPAAWREKSGAVRFFLMSGEKPYGKRYDYITRPNCTNGDLYIDTGINPDSTLDISVTLKSDYMSSSAIMSPFGISGFVFIMPKSGTEYYYDFFGAKNTTTSGIMDDTCLNVFGDAAPHDEKPHAFRLNREGLFIDGYRHLAFDQSKITPSAATITLTLFGRNGSWKQSGTTCSIYGATIVTNGVMACDLVPVAAPSGKVQMWDRVTRGWKGPAGSQTSSLDFVAGNDIGPYPPDCGSVERVSAAVNLAPAIAVSNPDLNAKTVGVALPSGHDAGLLFVVAGAEDEGMVFSNWATNALVQKVAADVDAVTVALPDDWIRNHYNIRFAWKSLAGLPYDYAVEELVSDGTGKANIRTGWIPTTNTAISVTAKTANDVCAFGIAGCFFAFQTGNNIYWNFFGNFSNATCDGSVFPLSYHEWSLGPTGASVDDRVLEAFTVATEATLTSNILLPFRASGPDSQVVAKEGDVAVKSAKIWEGDVLVRDFVPCVTNGVPVFYDAVRGGYYGSQTATPFVAGAPVVADGDFVSWSPAKELRIGSVIIVY